MTRKHEEESEMDALAASLERLRYVDRVSTLRRVASSMAHDLGTPLNVIEGRASMLLSPDVTPAEVQKNVAIILQQSAKMTAILRNLVSFARRKPLDIADVDLAVVLRAAISLAERAAKARGVTIRCESPEDTSELRGDSDGILQILMNLLTNGIQAMPDGGILTVTLRTEPHPPCEDPEGPASDHACVQIEDQGAGVPEDIVPRLFQPFVTTKGARDGTGLGLSTAQGIAKDHGGWIEHRNAPGRGACFTLLLPKGQANAE